jgi:hypothetical protein
MNINTVSMIALIASLGLAQPVLAQTDQQQPAGAEQTQQNAPEQPDAAAQPPAGGTSTEQQGAAPEGEASGKSTETAAPEAEADKDKMATTGGGQIVLQENDTFLASDFVGTNVYSPQDESLGEVTDLIFAKDGTLQGVVIGVGGFLGIGQKNVAFTMDRIQMTENEEGIRLSLEATSEELADAEPFKSKQTQKVEAEAEQARQEQESRAATGAGSPNPAAPPSQ